MNLITVHDVLCPEYGVSVFGSEIRDQTWGRELRNVQEDEKGKSFFLL